MSRRALALSGFSIIGLVAIGIAAFVLGRGETTAGKGGAAPVTPPTSLILYTIGASTDPYRDSSPAGFGVGGLRDEHFVRVDEVRDPQLGWFNGAETGDKSPPLDPARLARFADARGTLAVGPPRSSADGRYIAARLSARWPSKDTVAAVVIADAAGKPLRLLRSSYAISMFAWTPTGHRLAYTTSGFPDPHELFIVDSPQAPARRVLTTERHVDWVTWAPDSRRLLLDDPVENLWLLVPAQPPYTFVASPRLGGRPLWCCPVNAYATQ